MGADWAGNPTGNPDNTEVPNVGSDDDTHVDIGGSTSEIEELKGVLGAETVVAHRYVLHEILGSGGMAQVWKATDETLGRQVAVKILHPHLAGDDTFIKRFRQEAIAAARLSHPNIVSIYDTCSDGSHEAIVMELLEAKTLRDVLDERTLLDVPSVNRIGIRLLDALEAAHRAGVVHRDVKPSNILLCADGRVKIADFGIAKAEDNTELTREGSLLGTASYLAPEQLTDEPIDGRADLYSLGIVLYECLTGHLPFTGETNAARALSRLHNDPADPRKYRSEVPNGLAEAILRSLSRRPDDRFADAADFRAALAWEAEQPQDEPATIAIDEIHEDSTEPDSFGRSERRWLFPALFIVLIGTAVVVSYLLLQQNSSDNASSDAPTVPVARSPVTIASVQAYDPEGRGTPGENDALTGAVIDGDSATLWRTESYDSPTFFGSKTGVGLILELSAPSLIDSITVEGSTNGWSGELHILGPGESPNPQAKPNAILVDVSGPATAEFDGIPGSSVLLWITNLGTASGRHRVEIAEITITGTTGG